MFKPGWVYSIEDIEKAAVDGIVSTVAGDDGVFACCFAEHNPDPTWGTSKDLLYVFKGDDGSWQLMGRYDRAWTRQIASALIDLAHTHAVRTAQRGIDEQSHIQAESEQEGSGDC